LVIGLTLAATAAPSTGTVYTWRESDGVDYFTNSLDDVPEAQRSVAKTSVRRLEPATLEELAPAPARPTVPATTRFVDDSYRRGVELMTVGEEELRPTSRIDGREEVRVRDEAPAAEAVAEARSAAAPGASATRRDRAVEDPLGPAASGGQDAHVEGGLARLDPRFGWMDLVRGIVGPQ
jgi:hypothetical protein